MTQINENNFGQWQLDSIKNAFCHVLARQLKNYLYLAQLSTVKLSRYSEIFTLSMYKRISEQNNVRLLKKTCCQSPAQVLEEQSLVLEQTPKWIRCFFLNHSTVTVVYRFNFFILFCALLNEGRSKIHDRNFQSLACEFLISFTFSSILAMHWLIDLLFCRKTKLRL